jgi:hypothetical protein
MHASCVQKRLRLFQQLPDTIVSTDMIERFMESKPTSVTLYAVTTAGSRIVVTDNHALAVVAQAPDVAAPLLAFSSIGRSRPYLHCLRRLVLGAYLPGGAYDPFTETYGGEHRRVTRDWLGTVIEAVGDAESRRLLHGRGNGTRTKRALDSLLHCINRADTFATAGNGVNGTAIPWCAAIIAAVACRIVAGRHPCSIPQVSGFTINLEPTGTPSHG